MSDSTFVSVFGFGTKGRSSNVTSQRYINLYSDEGDDKAQLALYSRPGCVWKYFKDPSTGYGGPLRGATTATVLAGEFARMAQGKHSGSALLLTRFITSDDYLLTSTGPVQIAYLNSRFIMVDGVTGYDPNAGATLPSLGVTDFPAASSVCTLAQRFIINDPTAIGRFRWSDLGDPVSWPPLNYATAESCDDPLVLVFAHRGELLLFGKQSIEFWQPSGDLNLPFNVVGGATSQWGLGAFDTVRDVGGACMFVGRSGGVGNPQVCLLDGYSVKVVSTPDIEYIINKELGAGANACATPVIFGGHQWYVLNLGTTSLAFDLNNGTWREWQTEGSRWCGQYVFPFNGFTFYSDYRDGRIYVLDADTFTDDAAPIVREVITKHVFADDNRVSVQELAVEFEYGVGLVSGQGSDPQVMLQISRDGGHTWGNELWRAIGKLGQYAKRVFWTRLGRSRDFTFRLRISDPVKVVILNAAMRINR